MRHQPIDAELFKNNRRRLVEMLPPNAVAIFHSNEQMPRNGDQYFPYRQQSDFFYLTGIHQEKSILLLAPGCPDKKLREVLFTIKTNAQIAVWEGHKYTKEEAREISGIENIRWLDDYNLILREVMANAESVFLNSNELVKFKPDVKDRNYRLGAALKADYPLHDYKRSAPLLAKLRMLKSPQETELLKTACNLTEKAFRKILSTPLAGMHEFEVEALIDYEFKVNRAGGHGYPPIIASGKNSCVLHYVDNNDELKPGELLLMDFGAEYANYSADMSRTIPVSGKFTQRQKDCYNAVLRVFKTAKKLYIPGNSIDIVNEEVNKMMEKEIIGLGLITEAEIKNQDPENPLYKKYFMHGTAHFLGLDVHDVGSKHEIFKPGMVLTCEPGLYIREENIGIRIENDILITENGPVDLMESIPLEAEEIEGLMGATN
ncbi:MAG: aminopeptidase P N-terminal domain-containing protein [Bacteroidales bacterium]|nr:aminopeptidase P N-terminal domain-containing protein [Bacteroidales bacterium]